MNDPIPTYDARSCILLTSDETPFLLTFPGDSRFAPKMDPNTSYSPSIKTTFTPRPYPTVPALTSVPPTLLLTRSFVNLAITPASFQVLDNEASAELYTYFDTNKIAYQLVPPDNKRTNSAERSIQTFRRHFLSILATTHPSFPINHWPSLLPQAEFTLNVMRPYSDLPSISAYHGILR